MRKSQLISLMKKDPLEVPYSVYIQGKGVAVMGSVALLTIRFRGSDATMSNYAIAAKQYDMALQPFNFLGVPTLAVVNCPWPVGSNLNYNMVVEGVNCNVVRVDEPDYYYYIVRVNDNPNGTPVRLTITTI